MDSRRRQPDSEQKTIFPNNSQETILNSGTKILKGNSIFKHFKTSVNLFKNSTNQIPRFRTRDQNRPVRKGEFRLLLIVIEK